MISSEPQDKMSINKIKNAQLQIETSSEGKKGRLSSCREFQNRGTVTPTKNCITV